jgi:hypothetical protein
MKENPFLVEKKNRLRKLMGMLEKLGEISYSKAIALDEYNYGVSNEIAKHDIQILINLGSLEKIGATIKIKTPSHSL